MGPHPGPRGRGARLRGVRVLLLPLEAVESVRRQDHPSLAVRADDGRLLAHPALLSDLAHVDSRARHRRVKSGRACALAVVGFVGGGGMASKVGR